MIALILRNDTATAPPMALTLIDMGFQVICVESLGAADAMVRGSQIDVVITDELIGNTLSHNLLLSVERRNPHASAFVLTDKKGTDADELFLLLPSVYALLPVNAPTQMLIRFVNNPNCL